jgi:23S rRNA G2445 N2-methylase RlmL
LLRIAFSSSQLRQWVAYALGHDDEHEPPLVTEDALRNEPKDHADVVLTNPPFGKKSGRRANRAVSG